MYDNADDADGTTADGLIALLEKNADAKNDEPLLVLPIATRRILADEMKRSICCADTIKLDFHQVRLPLLRILGQALSAI